MTIANGGNVGIGTTSPSSELHVFSANGTTYASTAQLRVDGGGVNNNYAQIIFSDSALSDGKISYYPAAAAADRFFSISARTTESDFIIRGDGKVGIGTTSPGSILDVQQSNATNMGISFMNTFGATSNTAQTVDITSKLVGSGLTGQVGSMIRTGKEGDYSSGAARDAYMSFSVALNDTLTESMRITSGGNVGIGTTTPTNLASSYRSVCVNGSSAGFFETRVSDVSSGRFISDSNATGIGDVRSGKYLYLYTEDTERMRITSGGNVLIGTTTDNGSKLQVTGAATFSSSVTASSLIKSGGTAAQYLMADGSTRTTSSNAYTLKDWYASGNNVSSTETDLMTYTVPANTLVNNGDKLSFTFGGIFGSVANSKTLRVYFGTTSVVLNSITEVNVGWQITGTIIKDSATTYRFTIVQTNINYYPYTMSGTSGTVTNYTGTNVFKITGQGTSSSDLTAQMGTLQFIPAG